MNDRSSRRLLVMYILIGSLVVALFGRLYYLQIAAGPKYQQAALDNQSRDIVTPSVRGMILDDRGIPLAVNRTGLVVTVDNVALAKQADGGKAVLTRLAEVLNSDYKTLWTKTQLCGAKGAPKIGCWNGSPYQPIPVTKAAASEAALQIIEHAEQFPGIAAKPEGFRTYPADGGVNAAHILGYLGPVSTEDLQSSSARSVGLHPNDLVGKAGLEYQYDNYLRGQSGVRRVVVDRTGAVTRTLQETLPISGNHLVTSIDSKLQTVVEQQLAAAIARARAGAPGDKRGAHKADAGAAIVMDVNTGRIMAMASWPTYNPNIWLEGLSFKQASDLFSEAEGVPALSRAIQGQLAPASTFKVVSLAAASKAGYDFNAKYNCPASLKIGNRVFTNYESKGAGL
ncbi:MAG: penicillin-binding protein 2, partial [Actinobacteria bacterium]|nr:penicillin-binding protein 2 [Actinomycetota bacterium]